MTVDLHVRITDSNFPDLDIIITREGRPAVRLNGPYDTAATKFEPGVTNVIREEIQRIVDRRLKR